MKIPFSPPDVGEDELKEIGEALASGWITTGPRTKEFEKEIVSYCGSDMAVCLNSQTACAEMALRALGVGKNDEVITSAYTYTASASVACHVGAKLWWTRQKTALKWITKSLPTLSRKTQKW